MRGPRPRLDQRQTEPDVLLTHAEQEQYGREADRINLLATGDALRRHLY